MQIEVHEVPADTLGNWSGQDELHLRVLSDRLPDLPKVLLALSEDQKRIKARYIDKPSYYYPADTTKESHGFKFDDEWHFIKRHFNQEA